MKKLSLIIPCYNEAKNIPLLLSRCKEVIQRGDIEVVVVDNGSTDSTQSVLSELLPLYPFLSLVKVPVNQGYGHGILQGLSAASGELLGWTHADMQTDPGDVLKGLALFEKTGSPQKLFVKGRRYGRPLVDVFFTVGMALFESILLRYGMWDINAQPTLFHRSFFERWTNPPTDFSLDLYAYYNAKHEGLTVQRLPVRFGSRAHGVSHWNVSFSSKYRFIKRALSYSFSLKVRMGRNAKNSASC